MEAQFAIDGPGWSVSFQRRVGTANRGALPYVPLHYDSDQMRVLVPLRADEALWIAVMAEPTIVVDGRAGADPLRVVTLSQPKDGNMLQAFDAVVRSDQSLPLGVVSLECASSRNEIARDALTLILENPSRGTVQRIAIVLATPALYEDIAGLPAPGPTTERDEYRGWRLP